MVSVDLEALPTAVFDQHTTWRADGTLPSSRCPFLRATRLHRRRNRHHRRGTPSSWTGLEDACRRTGLRHRAGGPGHRLRHHRRGARPGRCRCRLIQVCGQAVRGAKWRECGVEALLRTLYNRAVKWAARNPGHSPYLIGSIDELYRIRERAPQLRPRINTVIAQPGLSAATRTSEQQLLLPGAHSWIKAVSKGAFVVYCSV